MYMSEKFNQNKNKSVSNKKDNLTSKTKKSILALGLTVLGQVGNIGIAKETMADPVNQANLNPTTTIFERVKDSPIAQSYAEVLNIDASNTDKLTQLFEKRAYKNNLDNLPMNQEQIHKLATEEAKVLDLYMDENNMNSIQEVIIPDIHLAESLAKLEKLAGAQKYSEYTYNLFTGVPDIQKSNDELKSMSNEGGWVVSKPTITETSTQKTKESNLKKQQAAEAEQIKAEKLAQEKAEIAQKQLEVEQNNKKIFEQQQKDELQKKQAKQAQENKQRAEKEAQQKKQEETANAKRAEANAEIIRIKAEEVAKAEQNKANKLKQELEIKANQEVIKANQEKIKAQKIANAQAEYKSQQQINQEILESQPVFHSPHIPKPGEGIAEEKTVVNKNTSAKNTIEPATTVIETKKPKAESPSVFSKLGNWWGNHNPVYIWQNRKVNEKVDIKTTVNSTEKTVTKVSEAPPWWDLKGKWDKQQAEKLKLEKLAIEKQERDEKLAKYAYFWEYDNLPLEHSEKYDPIKLKEYQDWAIKEIDIFVKENNFTENQKAHLISDNIIETGLASRMNGIIRHKYLINRYNNGELPHWDQESVAETNNKNKKITAGIKNIMKFRNIN
jgi:hypothetical protein